MSLTLALLFVAATKLQTPQWDLNQKVTYSTVAKSVKQICEELEKQTKVPIEPSVPAQTEVLVIDVKDVTLKDLMTKIAKVTSAEWEKGDSRIRLVRDTETIRREANEEIDFYAKTITKSMQKALDRATKLPPFDERAAEHYKTEYEALSEQRNSESASMDVYKRITSLEQSNPSGRLLDRLSVCLDPVRLASMRQDECFIFSTAPNRMQFPLTHQAAAAIQQFRKEWAIWAEFTQKTESSPQYWQREDQGLRSGKQPGKILVSCRWAQMKSAISITLQVLSPEGGILTERVTSLPVDDSLEIEGQTKRDDPATKVIPGSTIAFSPLALAWSDHVREIMNNQPVTKSTAADEVMQWAANPEKNDPLSLHASEAILALAKSKGRNLVANMPDQSILIGVMAAMGITKTNLEYFDLLQKISSMRFDDDGKWLVAYSKLPSRSRRERFDRHSLGQVMNALLGRGYLTLDEMAGFAVANDRNALSEISLMGFTVIAGNLSLLGTLVEYHDILGLYGSLSLAQKQALLKGDTIGYQNLLGVQRQRFERLYYGNNSSRSMSRSMTTREGLLTSSETIPTEAYPNGLPSQSSIQVKMTNKTVAVSNRMSQSAYTPESLAMVLLGKERPELFGGRQQELDQKFVVGNQASYEFTLAFSDNVSFTLPIIIDMVDKNATPVSYENLPASFRLEVEKALSRMRESYKNVNPGDMNPPVKIRA